MPRKGRLPETPPDLQDPVLLAVNPATSHDTPSRSLPFPIVAIGASAGGLEALNALLGAVGSDTGLAFVVIQHLLPERDSLLPDILARAVRMPVRQVEDQMAVEPDTVYVIPPGKDLVIGHGLLQLAPRTELRGQHRPIDQFMRSLAEEHGHKSIGVVLSGTGYDGSLGIQEVKAAGGITFAQDATAEQGGMPRAAIATGAVDLVLPPDEIGRELARIARHPYVNPEPGEATSRNEAALQRVLAVVRGQTGVEFGGYKRTTIQRRIARRVLLHKLEGIGDYERHLQAHPSEVATLFNDLLINVTSFFRNPDAYEALKSTVFPRLLEDRGRQEPLRVWALGCSTGEEAYSIAIVFSEFAEETGRRVPLQLFATDLNGAGIERARTGVYAKGIAQDVSPERLRKYFVEVDGKYRVVKPIRDMCVFARQNVVSDPPFSRMDLVACRNMLIYMEPGLQQRVIPTLHYALRGNGYLWLGGSETVGSHRELFDLVDARSKIYVKKPAPRGAAMPFARDTRAAQPPVSPLPAAPRAGAPDVQGEADRLLLARYSPPAVVVDANFDIVQFRGDTGPFLAHAPGRASMNLLKMLRDELVIPMRGALQRALKDRSAVREKGLRVRANGSWRPLEAEVIPIDGADAPAGFVVAFEEPAASLQAQARRALADALAESASPPPGGASGSREEIERLNRELAATREYLQSVVEDHDAATEELQSATEEVQSANEELQSLNEELETSKEEIQSANEELVTVNDELMNRNDELSASNNDLVNLLASVQMAIVMLGTDLRIRRYTPAAERLFKLSEGDIGRPLRDISFNLITPDLERLVVDTMQEIAPIEREVQDRAGRWYALRVSPYRTLENRIEGAVVVLVDIDLLKRAEGALEDVDRARNLYLATLAHELRNPLASVSNMVRLLAMPDTDAQQARLAQEVIKRQLGNMVRMVDDLLDIARITQGKLEVRMEALDVGLLLEATVASTAHEREAHRQSIALTLPPRPLWVNGDRIRLEQVVGNLLQNASKFSPPGARIWVSAEEDRTGGRAEVTIRVRDEGAGIPAGMLASIFDLFVQAENPAGRGREGLGLGLTLAERLVELQQGRIEAFSPGPGFGSEFVVRLPFAHPPRAPAAIASAAPAQRAANARRVLIVDDNLDSALSMSLLLRQAGHETLQVHTGSEAVEAALRFNPHAVLLDIGLPDMDGHEVARLMREEPALDGALVIAVTGYGREQDMAESRAAGIDAHLVKPVDMDRVFELVAAGRKPRASSET